MRENIKTLYRYSKANNTPLLGSTSTADFWTAYKNNYAVYDRFFRDRFLSWYYWLTFSDDESVSDIFADFTEAIQAHIAINEKRYSELYRVHVLPSTAYDIVNNYDLTEAHTVSRSESGNNTSGARQDSTSGTDTSGAREDTTSGSATDGARSDSATTNAGAQTTTETGQIEGFNSSDFSDSDKKTIAAGAHSDSTNISKGAQTNTNSTTVNKGAQSDSHSETFNKGAQSDSHSLTGSETINITRKGNIGVQTPADVIGGHIKLWSEFDFYRIIFDEIAKNFLVLDKYY